MAVPATRLELEHSVEVEAPLARLEERTESIQRDVRRIETKVDAVATALADSFAAVNDRIAVLSDRVSAVSERVTAFDGTLARLESSLLKWVIATGLAFGSLAFAIAKFVQ